MTFKVESSCACCGRPIRFSMAHDLSYQLEEPDTSPLSFVPMVDFTRLRAPSIIDAF